MNGRFSAEVEDSFVVFVIGRRVPIYEGPGPIERGKQERSVYASWPE